MCINGCNHLPTMAIMALVLHIITSTSSITLSTEMKDVMSRTCDDRGRGVLIGVEGC